MGLKYWEFNGMLMEFKDTCLALFGQLMWDSCILKHGGISTAKGD